MSDEKKNVTLKYKIPDDHILYYTSSVFGGFNQSGMMEMNFFHDTPAMPDSSILDVDEKGMVINDKMIFGDHQVVRRIQTGIVMGMNECKSFHSWLGSQIEAWEKQKK